MTMKPTGQTTRPHDGTNPNHQNPVHHSDQAPDHPSRLARPETHQNLIHPAKEQRTPRKTAPSGSRGTRHSTAIQPRPRPGTNRLANPLTFRDAACHPTNQWKRPPMETPNGDAQWRRPMETPNGDDRDRTDDPLLAKQVLSQLSYAPLKHAPEPGTDPRGLIPGN